MSKHICISFFVLTLLFLAGCKSSRNAIKDDVYTEVEADGMADDVNRRAVVEEARRWLGTKYRYGGNDRTGVDCSGMVVQVYLKAANVKLPRNSAQQQRYCRKIKRKELAEGDLVFFATGRDKTRVSHVGVYIGGDRMIHASSSRGVIVSSLDEKYYSRNYHSSGCVDVAFGNLAASKKPKTNNRPASPHHVAEISLDDLNKIMRRDTVADFAPEVEQQFDSIYSSWFD